MYNNIFDGDPGVNVTGWIYIQGGISNAYVYNNFFSWPAGRTANNGSFSFQSSGGSTNTNGHAYNNTVIDHNLTTSSCVRLDFATNLEFRNNLLVGCGTGVSSENNSTYAIFDNNVWSVNGWTFNSSHPNTFAGWQSACNCDAHSKSGSAAQINVSNTGILGSGSIAIGAGANLTSLGITTLDPDKLGAARPP